MTGALDGMKGLTVADEILPEITNKDLEFEAALARIESERIERAELRARLEKLDTDAESVFVLNPVSAYVKLNRMGTVIRGLRPKYHLAIEQCSRPAHQEPFQTIGIFYGGDMAAKAGRKLAELVQIQSAWQQLQSTIDRKYSTALAVFSLYISLVSLVLSVLTILA